MKRNVQIIIMVLLTLSLMQCAALDKNRIKANRQLVIEACSNKKLISISRRSSAKNKQDNLDIGVVTSYDSEHDTIKYESIHKTKKVNLSIIYDIDTAEYFNNDEKLKVTISDRSFFIGTLADKMADSENITFLTPGKKYTIPKSKVLEIKYYNVSYVKLILLDGSEIFGTIIKDDGHSISLKTILGDMSFPRKEILKIEYVK